MCFINSITYRFQFFSITRAVNINSFIWTWVSLKSFTNQLLLQLNIHITKLSFVRFLNNIHQVVCFLLFKPYDLNKIRHYVYVLLTGFETSRLSSQLCADKRRWAACGSHWLWLQGSDEWRQHASDRHQKVACQVGTLSKISNIFYVCVGI